MVKGGARSRHLDRLRAHQLAQRVVEERRQLPRPLPLRAASTLATWLAAFIAIAGITAINLRMVKQLSAERQQQENARNDVRTRIEKILTRFDGIDLG